MRSRKGILGSSRQGCVQDLAKGDCAPLIRHIYRNSFTMMEGSVSRFCCLEIMSVEEDLPFFLLLLQGLSAGTAMVMQRSSGVKGGANLLCT